MLLSLVLFFSLQPAPSSLNGVYRIDIPASDRLYSVVAGASSNIPFAEQQRFFIDLAVRLTPPDLLAIEQRGTQISLGSSRAPRMNFAADGVTHTLQAADGHIIHVRLSADRAEGNERLVFTSNGNAEDNFSVTFESIDHGRRLRVVRRIGAQGLDQPLVILTIYNKISDVARWELYGESQVEVASRPSSNSNSRSSVRGDGEMNRSVAPTSELAGAKAAPSAAVTLRNSLSDWIAATNNRDINQQMTFYVERLNRFYLKSDVPRNFVREEKERVFTSARTIDIQAAEPEIIFQDGGRTAVMRYRKKYRIEQGPQHGTQRGVQSRQGEVIQELRWQLTPSGWRIFSERDIRVLR